MNLIIGFDQKNKKITKIIMETIFSNVLSNLELKKISAKTASKIRGEFIILSVVIISYNILTSF